MNPGALLVGMHTSAAFIKSRTLKQIMEILYDPAILHLGIHPEDMKHSLKGNMCSCVHSCVTYSSQEK